MFSNDRTKLNKNVFSFVPNSSLLWWRVLSRVKMNVLRPPLTVISTLNDAVEVNPERPPRRP